MKISVFCGLVAALAFICLATAQESCRTPDGKNGQCIVIFECEKVYRLVRKRDEYSMKYLRESICSNDRETLVCCEEMTPGPPPPATPRRPPHSWVY